MGASQEYKPKTLPLHNSRFILCYMYNNYAHCHKLLQSLSCQEPQLVIHKWKLSLRFIKHYALKTYGVVEV
jgi:hypothetical protein